MDKKYIVTGRYYGNAAYDYMAAKCASMEEAFAVIAGEFAIASNGRFKYEIEEVNIAAE